MLENLSNTSGQPNAVVVIQPGTQVQPVVLVDQYGSAVTISGGGSVASFLATTTVDVNVSAAAAPGSAQVLTATSSSTATWQNSASGFSNPMTAAGDLIDGGAAGAAQRLPIGSVGEVLTVSASTVPTWASVSSFTNPMTTPGDIIYESSGTVPTRLGIGTVGQALTVSSGTAPAWGVLPLTGGGTGGTSATTAYNNISPMTTTGDIEYESASHTAARLAGNTATTPTILTSTGTGSAAQAPVWQTLTTLGALQSVNNLSDVSSESTAFNNLSPMTTLGDSLYGGASGAATRLAGNTSATPKVWTSTGTGSAAQAPSLQTLSALGILQSSNNLDDVGSPAAALGNIGGAAVSPGIGTAGFGLGLLTMDPLLASSNNGLTNETVYLCGAVAPASRAVTKLGCVLLSAGVTPGAGVNVMALFSSSGSLLEVTGDMTSMFEGSEDPIEGTISSCSLVAGDLYYLAVLTSFTVTTPKIFVSAGTFPVMLNSVVVAGSLASQATMPGSITISGLVLSAHPPLAYAR